MMSLVIRTLIDKRWFIVGWSLGFAALAVLMVVFYPSMRQEGSLDQLIATMPPALQGFVGDLANLREFSTYLATQMFDIRLQILGGVMAIILALGLSVADEDKGMMRTLLALPISRSRLLFGRWLAIVIISGAVVLASGVGVLALQGTIGESISFDVLIRLLFVTWLLITSLATITYAVAMATGSRSFAMVVGILIVAGSFILTTFSAGVDWLKDYEMWSIYHYYQTVDVVKSGIVWSDVAVLMTLTFAPLIIAWLLFRRRDVR